MQITGTMLIGHDDVAGTEPAFRAVDPATGGTLEPAYGGGGQAHVDAAARLAHDAFASYRAGTPARRAAFLREIGARIMGLGDVLIERAMRETGLPRARLEGERGRTVRQLELFAEVVEAGDWHGVRIDHAQPGRAPLPRADIRMRHVPVGPVAVFGASNFPLAFSVAGGDTASALAAGAPVVVKGHPAHPGTSELVGRAIRAAVQAQGLHEGVFSLLFGADHGIGLALASHPRIKAVGFTGSRSGGLALMRAAAARPEPIPVYAEMSSINPVYLLPGALKARARAVAEGFAASLLGSAGQLCTCPGLLVGLDGPDLDAFIDAAAGRIREGAPGTMLTPSIHRAYTEGVQRLSERPGVAVRARGPAPQAPNQCRAALLEARARAFIDDPEGLGQEVFGSCALILRCADEAEMLRVARSVEGQLTATLHLEPGPDDALVRALMPVLELSAGRILANGFPTGVEVCHAMVHGGPFPATSDPRGTSVGTAAILRFLRPVAYQDIPDAFLPEPLQAANPWGVPRAERR
ncbi:Ketoglutarate semialdehyde dehydrogenase [Castellaniella defragrans 65Phen]|uniref:Ketoglutarate semialdehyde dehydrogenase n=1 Tax=Castellaniella defragrans (strain DSM 12143 / CCUG 39792 / 65Phen) TaxID=1437824 RepID=W8X0B4_CASD6|nr:aldehyde dehydrogenase (NADP(+)) [Castellaniella defragrans]CDM25319.1 Ketoglutarate semialdehyde dehydrogenase [Castellaniella defragrans 65Phen]